MRTTLAAAICAALFLAAGAGRASAGELSRITVPFPFMVKGHELPAGRYEVRNDEIDPSVVIIEGIDRTRDRAIIETKAEAPARLDSHGPSLTFTHHAGAYQLSAIDDGDYVRDVVGR